MISLRSLFLFAVALSVFCSAHGASGGIRSRRRQANSAALSSPSSSLDTFVITNAARRILTTALRIWPTTATTVGAAHFVANTAVADGGARRLKEEEDEGQTDGEEVETEEAAITDEDEGGDGDGDGDVDGGDGTETSDGETVDGNAEDGSFMDTLGDLQDAAMDTYNTDPNEWTAGQKAGVAVGVFVGFIILVCLIRCCCCK